MLQQEKEAKRIQKKQREEGVMELIAESVEQVRIFPFFRNQWAYSACRPKLRIYFAATV